LLDKVIVHLDWCAQRIGEAAEVAKEQSAQ
jgi:hypothetical protein